MLDFILQPWPWYVAGPLIGLFVPLLLVMTGKGFGISSSLRHTCAAALPTRADYFRYDWRAKGFWNLVFVLGIALGGLLGATVLSSGAPIDLAAATVADLRALGVTDFSGLVPPELFSWNALATGPGLAMIAGGGFLIGFGARYAGGCTSGHAITGMATFQVASLVAVVGFFLGGLAVTYVVYPWLLG
jgi:uncharacterized membrane protein YedE/YeeE